MLLCLLLCLLAGAEGWLARGEGASFRRVVWYHFPKTGGTTMRGIVHKFCESRGYNMTGNYNADTAFGLKTNQETFLAGITPHFIYGHSETDFASYANEKDGESKDLYVFMVRSPLSWMLSRHQHHMRKSQNSQNSFVKSISSFGGEYFHFLDNVHRNLSEAWFERNIHQIVSLNGDDELNLRPSPASINIEDSFSSSPVGIASGLERLLFRKFSANVVVLVQDHYSESLQILDYVFGTTHFTSSNSYRHNTAREGQDKGVPFGTVDELAAAGQMLEMHQTLYNLCLKYFLHHMKVISIGHGET